MTIWQRDAETLNSSLYNFTRQAERDVNRIHSRYRAELVRVITYYLNRGNLNQSLSVTEVIDSLMMIPVKRAELRAQASPMAGRTIDRMFNLVIRTRLESLISEIMLIMIRMNVELERLITSAVREGYTRAYYHTSYNIARRSRIGVPIPRLRDSGITDSLSEDWSGLMWQSRQWNNNQTILNYMLGVLDNLTNRNISSRFIIGAITYHFEFSRWQTKRILRTERAHYSSVGSNQAYELNEIEWYVYIATLDCRTCGNCAELDGEVFRLRDRRVGENAPTLHPHCRCTEAPTFPDEEESRWRRARNDEGRNETIDGSITYREWFERFVR